LTSPRPYVAAAAAAVLAALYFVPSATAAPAHAAPARSTSSQSSQSQSAATAQQAAPRLGDLADTGAVNTKPYIIGGAVFLAAGAGLVLNAGRRRRDEEPDAA
jgi:hypothetical protein